jgi:3'(2'), 5'-bisphosphate nucleotidase
VGAERVASPDANVGAAEPIRTRPFPGSPWIAAVSRSHGDSRSDAFIDSRPGAVRKPLGSAVKFCRIAEGGVDIYPRLAPTGEWDVAAGHALIVAAGGKMTDGRGGPLRFGQSRDGFLVPEFIAWGDPSAAI